VAFDPEKGFSLRRDTDSDEVLRKLLDADETNEVSDEPEEEAESWGPWG
jgi:hypothetical protein